MNSSAGLAQRVRRRAAGRWSLVRGLPRPLPLTSGVKSRSAGLDLPLEFPGRAYDELQPLVMDRLSGNASIQREFNGAWNAVAYRFLAAAELDASLRRSIEKFGADPPTPERYRQERDLFAFLGNACSVLDSLAYALYALNAGPHPLEFPLTTSSDRMDVEFLSTKDLYATHFPGQRLTQQLGTLADSTEFDEMRRSRSFLAQRSSASLDAIALPPARDGLHVREETELEPATTAHSRAWVAEALRIVVPGALEFVKADPPIAS